MDCVVYNFSRCVCVCVRADRCCSTAWASCCCRTSSRTKTSTFSSCPNRFFRPSLSSFFLSSSFLVTFTCCRLTLSFRIESKSNLHAEPHFRGDPFKVRRHLNALYLIIWHTLMCLVFVKDFINLNVIPIHPSIIQPSYGSQVHWRLIPAHENVWPYLENLTQPKNPQQVSNPTS